MECDIIEFASYADNTTLYTYGQSFEEIIEKLEIEMSKISEWFHHNGFKAIWGKFHFLLCPVVDRPIIIIGSTIKASKEEVSLGSTIKASKEEVLLGVRIDNDLKKI